jgi:Na+/alanine symporter
LGQLPLPILAEFCSGDLRSFSYVSFVPGSGAVFWIWTSGIAACRL